MKAWIYCLPAFLVLSLAGQAMANDYEDRDAKERLEFQRYRESERQRYTFEDYIADLKEAARTDEVIPGNLVSQLASNNKRQEYKPLNPITIFRW
jgi:hypothetical protein